MVEDGWIWWKMVEDGWIWMNMVEYGWIWWNLEFCWYGRLKHSPKVCKNAPVSFHSFFRVSHMDRVEFWTVGLIVVALIGLQLETSYLVYIGSLIMQVSKWKPAQITTHSARQHHIWGFQKHWLVFWRLWCQHRTVLGGGFKYFLFSSLFGEMIQFD